MYLHSLQEVESLRVLVLPGDENASERAESHDDGVEEVVLQVLKAHDARVLRNNLVVEDEESVQVRRSLDGKEVEEGVRHADD